MGGGPIFRCGPFFAKVRYYHTALYCTVEPGPVRQLVQLISVATDNLIIVGANFKLTMKTSYESSAQVLTARI